MADTAPWPFVLMASNTHCCRRNVTNAVLVAGRREQKMGLQACAAACATHTRARGSCLFFSHAAAYNACYLCSACDIGLHAQQPRSIMRHYASWCLAHPSASSSTPSSQACVSEPYNGSSRSLVLPLRLLPPALLASVTHPAHCPAMLVMSEDRELLPPSRFFWAKAAVLNLHAARRHNWSFMLVRPQRNPKTSPAANWCKLKAMDLAISRMLAAAAFAPSSAESGCGWILFLDSDAFVRTRRGVSVDLIRTLGATAAHHAGEQVEAVLMQEDVNLDAGFENPQPFNAGVIAMRASQWSLDLLRTWFRMGSTPGACHRFRRAPYFEQSCLTIELLRPQNEVRHRVVQLPHNLSHRLVLAPMRLANSPWGEYVRHVWSGVGVEMRRTAFDEELAALQIKPRELIEEVQRRTVEALC